MRDAGVMTALLNTLITNSLNTQVIVVCCRTLAMLCRHSTKAQAEVLQLEVPPYTLHCTTPAHKLHAFFFTPCPHTVCAHAAHRLRTRCTPPEHLCAHPAHTRQTQHTHVCQRYGEGCDARMMRLVVTWCSSIRFLVHSGHHWLHWFWWLILCPSPRLFRAGVSCSAGASLPLLAPRLSWCLFGFWMWRLE